MSLAQLQGRPDVAADWTANNPVLLAGEWGHETDTGRAKIGDGATAWNALPYFADTSVLETDSAALAADLVALAADVTPMGVWAAYTPTWAVFTPVNPDFRYTQVGKLVTVRFATALGTGASGIPTITVPVPPNTPAAVTAVGVYTQLYLGAPYPGELILGTDDKVYFLNSSTNPGNLTIGSGTGSPNIAGTFTYEAA